MKCTSPITRRYLDALTNQWKECVCPCGRCAACRHNQQDQWVIRLGEEAKEKKHIIFDTLTIAPGSMYYEDMKEPQYFKGKPCLYGSTEKWSHWKVNSWKKWTSFHRYYPNISYDSYKILRNNNFLKLAFPKDEVQKWIKRGRQAYKRHYGVNPDVSYFLVEEYGSTTSRPHFHVLFYGVSLADYMRFWGKEWNFDFGFIKPVYHQYSVSEQKDIRCMTRYVSKYIMKGSDELALVKDGVYDKPFRLISKGIGSGYLRNRKFDVYKNPDFVKWSKFGKPSLSTHLNRLNQCLGGSPYWKADCSSVGAIKESKDYIKSLLHLPGKKDLKAYWTEVSSYKRTCEEMDRLQAKRDELDFIRECCEDTPISRAHIAQLKKEVLDLSILTDDDLNNLCVYYDQGGYPHGLPRYYKTKILHYENQQNIYSHSVSSLLSARAELLTNQSISQFAFSMGYSIRPEDINRQKGTIKGLPACTAFMVLHEYTLAERSKAKTLSERCELKAHNFYNRIKTRTDAPALL